MDIAKILVSLPAHFNWSLLLDDIIMPSYMEILGNIYISVDWKMSWENLTYEIKIMCV